MPPITNQQLSASSGLVNLRGHDRRWIRIQRPTVVVGGELTMDNLEIRHDPRTNTCKLPTDEKQLRQSADRRALAASELLPRNCSTAGSFRWKTRSTF